MNFMVPAPRFPSWEAFNEQLEAQCLNNRKVTRVCTVESDVSPSHATVRGMLVPCPPARKRRGLVSGAEACQSPATGSPACFSDPLTGLETVPFPPPQAWPLPSTAVRTFRGPTDSSARLVP